MLYFFAKILVTAVAVAAVSELARRTPPLAAILASLPLTSILAFLWIYRDTRNTQLITDLAGQVFWALLPSLLFFVILPLLLKAGVRFGWAMVWATATMAAGYAVYAAVLKRLGIDF